MDVYDGRIRRDDGEKWSNEQTGNSFNRILTRMRTKVMIFNCEKGFFSPGQSRIEALT